MHPHQFANGAAVSSSFVLNVSTSNVYSGVCPRLSRGSGSLCLFRLAGPMSHFIVADALDASLPLLLVPRESKQM